MENKLAGDAPQVQGCTCNPKPLNGQHWAGCAEGTPKLEEAREYFNLWWIKGNPNADCAQHAAVLLAEVDRLRSFIPASTTPGTIFFNCPHCDSQLQAIGNKTFLLATPASTARTDGWVSVEERLPKVGHWCWVVYHGVVQRMAAHLAGNGFACSDGYEWRWSDDSADRCPLEEITHWQPFPAAPGRVPPLCNDPDCDDCYDKREALEHAQKSVPQAEPPK